MVNPGLKVTNLSCCLLSFYSKEPVAILWRAVDVTKCPAIRHVLGYEADLVNRMVVQTILKSKYCFVYKKALPLINAAYTLTPVFSSLIFRPSTAIWISTLCLCSPEALIAVFSSAKAS